MNKNKIKVGISHGDVNGISYEIIIKTLLDNRILELCTPIVYGSPKVAGYHRKVLNISNFSLNAIKTPDEANPKRPNVVNCIEDNVRVELGKSTSTAGEASFKALERATQDLKEGKIDVLVTAPINKKNIQSRDFEFPGHTEYLKERFGSEEVLMLMVSDAMRIGVVAGHVPVNEISSCITKENILQKLRIMHRTLLQDFAIRKPRIAVLGLNPHAGDDGLIGKEDKEIILPAIMQAKDEGIAALGLYPADGFFGSEHFNRFDAILAMYHDQGLIPFKALAFDAGVNFTAGLPAVRTSPAHGTAYDLAGLDKASPNSFRQAIYLGIDVFKNRQSFLELEKNTLPNYDLPENE